MLHQTSSKIINEKNTSLRHEGKKMCTSQANAVCDNVILNDDIHNTQTFKTGKNE